MKSYQSWRAANRESVAIDGCSHTDKNMQKCFTSKAQTERLTRGYYWRNSTQQPTARNT